MQASAENIRQGTERASDALGTVAKTTGKLDAVAGSLQTLAANDDPLGNKALAGSVNGFGNGIRQAMPWVGAAALGMGATAVLYQLLRRRPSKKHWER
jgi:hypothetical protein